ncbi:Protein MICRORCHIDIA 4 [Linum perenne]
MLEQDTGIRRLREAIGALKLICSKLQGAGHTRSRNQKIAMINEDPPTKKLKQEMPFVPSGFLAPLPQRMVLPAGVKNNFDRTAGGGGGGDGVSPVARGCKQFWKAGDYEDTNGILPSAHSSGVGLDHVRVHPKFLHSNATSHKWALGAFAELLDNAVDEIAHGATYVNVDVLRNKKDGSNMLLVQDNGGGMTPDNMRQCMSLGYSVKSKSSNTIGQYGNGFKTSTMRLGADVIVFSRWRAPDGASETRSIGLLSYTFLRSTKKEDIVVPMVDFVKTRQQGWKQLIRSTVDDWDMNLKTILLWSPFVTENDLIFELDCLGDKGTRIIIYNLWEDDEGKLELDFDIDPQDIQIRGANRDEKNIEMAKQYPNSRHFLTYRHSLKSYASILYMKLPSEFRITLRGTRVKHHDIVKDMMLSQTFTYKPHLSGLVNNNEVSAVLQLGFVKDAHHHIDVQGFNVYHKNRLIKPFWRVWNAAGSDGRGVIGVLEANFIEPAHDKQGFERTTVLSRLEARLKQFQKQFWTSRCHEIGYSQRVGGKRGRNTTENETSCSQSKLDEKPSNTVKKPSVAAAGESGCHPPTESIFRIKDKQSAVVASPPSPIYVDESNVVTEERSSKRRGGGSSSEENILQSLAEERAKNEKLESRLEEVTEELDKLKKEADLSNKDIGVLTDILQQEKEWRDAVEQTLRETIDNLEQKVKQLEKVVEEEDEEMLEGEDENRGSKSITNIFQVNDEEAEEEEEGISLNRTTMAAALISSCSTLNLIHPSLNSIAACSTSSTTLKPPPLSKVHYQLSNRRRSSSRSKLFSKTYSPPVMQWQDCTVKKEIDVPVSVAYDCYSDREAIAKWMPFISSVQILEDKPDLSRWSLKYKAFGQDIEFSWLARNMQVGVKLFFSWCSCCQEPLGPITRVVLRGF